MKRVNPKEMNNIGGEKIIDYGSLSRMSLINPDVEVTIKNVTLANGCHAIYIYNDGTLILNGSTFKVNDANVGDAIFNTVFSDTSDVYSGFVENTASKVQYIYGDGHFSDGIPLTFTAANGNINPESGGMVDGSPTQAFTVINPGTGKITATIDSQPILGNVIIDKTEPTVISVDPDNGMTKVATNKTIKIKFNKEIKAGNLWIDLINSADETVPFNTSINGRILTIKPTSKLAESKYKLILHTGSITDLVGNPLTIIKSYFSVGTSPTMVKSEPANGAIKVAVNKTIKITFSETIKEGTLQIDLTNSAGKTIPFNTAISGSVLTIKPTSKLVKSEYRLTLQTGCITGLEGNPLTTKTITFITGASPRITSVDPKNNIANIVLDKTIKITFNEDIKATPSYWIELVDKNGTATAIKKSIRGKVLTITPTANLKANTKYYLKIHTGSVTDLAGNPFEAKTIKFITKRA